MSHSLGTHSPSLAACSLLKQCQLAISLQSEAPLLTQHCRTAQASLLGHVGMPPRLLLQVNGTVVSC